MVKLNIVVEGGICQTDVAAETANNAESLRESLYGFFTRLLGRDDIDIQISTQGGYRNAARHFALSTDSFGLFVDSDCPACDTHMWFNKLINNYNPERTIVIPNEKKDHVFFMIQEMEAWFLKQPSCLEKWADKEGYTRLNPSETIAEHSLLKNKSVEDIAKPSEKLALLLKHFFSKEKKKARYGKLTTAPTLLDCLDVTILAGVDIELQRFIKSFSVIS